MSGNKVIPGIKLIRHNAYGIDEQDDPSYPWKMEVVLALPEFMYRAMRFFLGEDREIIVIRGETKESLEEVAKLNDFFTHPRLISINIYKP